VQYEQHNINLWINQPFLDWVTGKRAASLGLVYKEILDKIDGSITWLSSQRSSKKNSAWFFEWSIVMGTVARDADIAEIASRNGHRFGWLASPQHGPVSSH